MVLVYRARSVRCGQIAPVAYVHGAPLVSSSVGGVNWIWSGLAFLHEACGTQCGEIAFVMSLCSVASMCVICALCALGKLESGHAACRW